MDNRYTLTTRGASILCVFVNIVERRKCMEEGGRKRRGMTRKGRKRRSMARREALKKVGGEEVGIRRSLDNRYTPAGSAWVQVISMCR